MSSSSLRRPTTAAAAKKPGRKDTAEVLSKTVKRPMVPTKRQPWGPLPEPKTRPRSKTTTSSGVQTASSTDDDILSVGNMDARRASCTRISNIQDAEHCLEAIQTVFGSQRLRFLDTLGSSQLQRNAQIPHVAGVVLNRAQNKVVGVVTHDNKLQRVQPAISIPSAAAAAAATSSNPSNSVARNNLYTDTGVATAPGNSSGNGNQSKPSGNSNQSKNTSAVNASVVMTNNGAQPKRGTANTVLESSSNDAATEAVVKNSLENNTTSNKANKGGRNSDNLLSQVPNAPPIAPAQTLVVQNAPPLAPPLITNSGHLLPVLTPLGASAHDEVQQEMEENEPMTAPDRQALFDQIRSAGTDPFKLKTVQPQPQARTQLANSADKRPFSSANLLRAAQALKPVTSSPTNPDDPDINELLEGGGNEEADEISHLIRVPGHTLPMQLIGTAPPALGLLSNSNLLKSRMMKRRQVIDPLEESDAWNT